MIYPSFIFWVWSAWYAVKAESASKSCPYILYICSSVLQLKSWSVAGHRFFFFFLYNASHLFFFGSWMRATFCSFAAVTERYNMDLSSVSWLFHFFCSCNYRFSMAIGLRLIQISDGTSKVIRSSRLWAFANCPMKMDHRFYLSTRHVHCFCSQNAWDSDVWWDRTLYYWIL